MNPAFVLFCISAYFILLLLIAWFTSRQSNSESYFSGNKQSPWIAVALGMVGDSLSGVTYISVPGSVGTSNFSYLQLVLGYFVGYYVISFVLLPLYYKLNLLSIYSYLEQRFGRITQKTGSFYFILSRTLGAAGRLFLAAGVIQLFVFDQMNGVHIPFAMSVSIIIGLMLLYTYRGGIKTLVWTDTLQSIFLIAGVLLSITAILNELSWSLTDAVSQLMQSPYSTVFHWDWQKASYFPKQFLGGIFIAVAMTGLDQNMMQKNLSCKNLGEAQKNINWFSLVMVLVNIFFLSLGALLFLYYQKAGLQLPMNTEGSKVLSDKVFPNLALNHLGILAGVAFIVGLTAATFSSADSVLTTLTTSVYIDMLEVDKKTNWDEKKKVRLRHWIHISFAVILLLTILAFKAMNNRAIVDTILMLAGYTYGPLLGLFAFGLFSKRKVNDNFVPFICVASPLLTYLFSVNAKDWLSYETGNELIIINGALTYLGLGAISLSRK